MKRMLSSPAILALVLALGVPLVAHALEKEAAAANPALAKPAAAGVTENSPAQPPATAKEAAMASKPVAMSHAHAKAMSKLDLNHATREQLMSLPGVDQAVADKIIAARPFHSRGELLEKKLVTKAEYEKVRTHVTAGAVAKKG